MNASLRAKLHRRLSAIDAQLYASTHPPSDCAYFAKYGEPSIHGIPGPEKQKLVQLFWGNRDDSKESHHRYASASEALPSPFAQRTFFLNGSRNARQRCLAASGGSRRVTLDRITLFSRDARFMLIDAVRYYFISRVFGDVVPMTVACPWINAAKLREFINALPSEAHRSLAEYGINVDEMEHRITSALRPSLCLEQ
jgi:hypothetical protein